MALAEYRVGALHVVEHVSDTDWINRRLRQIDPHLFVEKQLTFMDEEVWCVVEDTGERWGTERFVCVHEFRDAQGRPIPVLTERILDELHRRARDKETNRAPAGEIARRRNAQKREREQLEAAGHYEAIARDFQNHRAIGNFAIVPRSPQLARTRARVRNETVEQRRAFDEARRIAARFARA